MNKHISSASASHPYPKLDVSGNMSVVGGQRRLILGAYPAHARRISGAYPAHTWRTLGKNLGNFLKFTQFLKI